MRALLHDLLISLESTDSRVLDGWAQLFDREIVAAAALPAGQEVAVQLRAGVARQAPGAPPHVPDYIEHAPVAGEETNAARGRQVSFHGGPHGGTLTLARPAQIEFHFAEGRAELILTPHILDAGSLEDISAIALAPFLRRRGLFMVHAFALAGEDTALLISGPSGSGKTTSGLAMLRAGWKYLANDLTLLGREQGTVLAYPSPGTINVHPHTLALLPAYASPPRAAVDKIRGKYIFSRSRFLDEAALGAPAAVRAVLFAQPAAGSLPRLTRLPASVGLARLIVESMDQWDQATYQENLDLLTRLGRQAGFYELHLPRAGAAELAQAAALLNRRFLN